jgi:hypothetical protein
VRRDGAGFDFDVLLFAFVRDDFTRMEKDSYHHYAKPVLRIGATGELDVRNVPVPNDGERMPWLVRNASLFERLRIVELARPALRALRPPAPGLTAGELADLSGKVFEALAQLCAERPRDARLLYLPTVRRLRESRRALARADRARGAQARPAVRRSRPTELRSRPRSEVARFFESDDGPGQRLRGRAQRSGPQSWVTDAACSRTMRALPASRPRQPRRPNRPRPRAPDRGAPATCTNGSGNERILPTADSRRHDPRRQAAPPPHGRRRYPRRARRRGSARCAQRARTIDASGCAVAPGFVDIHTHYDAQLFWDRMLSISPWHGVTSVVIGNCGFGIAPTRPQHRDLILRTLESVEGMSLDALRAGVGSDWPFETFPEFLDALDARGTAIHVAALGRTHARAPVRDGRGRDRARGDARRGRADAGDRARRARRGRDRLRHLARAHARRLCGQAGAEPRRRVLGGRHARAHDRRVRSRDDAGDDRPRPVHPAARRDLAGDRQDGQLDGALQGISGPDAHRQLLALNEKVQAQGIDVVPQVSCRPLVLEFQFAAPFPFESLPDFKRCRRPTARARSASTPTAPGARASARPRARPRSRATGTRS